MTPTIDAPIRLAHPDDADALATLKLATFRETFVEGFAIPYPPADLATFEAEAYHPAKVAAELADAARRTWVAERDGRLIGYAQVGPCKLPHPDARPADGELYQLYVTRAAQGTGAGRRLLDRAIGYLEVVRPGPLWVGVWAHNHRAKAIYTARGFEFMASYRFLVGDWVDEDQIYRRP